MMTHYHIAVDGEAWLTAKSRREAAHIADYLLKRPDVRVVQGRPCTEYHKVPLQTHIQGGKS